MRSYNITKINLPVHAFLMMNDLTYQSCMLRGWYHVLPPFRTVAGGARHVAPHISESRCLWRFLDRFRLKDSQTWDERFILKKHTHRSHYSSLTRIISLSVRENLLLIYRSPLALSANHSSVCVCVCVCFCNGLAWSYFLPESQLW